MKRINDRLKEIGIELNEEQLSQLDTYYKMLTETNKYMNLTAITEYDDVITKHFADSLQLVRCADLSDEVSRETPLSLIDVGTGAGFPGMVLKIAFPHLRVTLLDSLDKRVKFLDSVISRLGLKDIEAVHYRAEDAAKKEIYRDSFDLAVSRAVASLPTLTEYCMPFVKPGGYFIAYKSGNIEEELRSAGKAVTALSGKVEELLSYSLPETDISRSLVKIKKLAPTDNKYPRRAGKP
ncbi:MAG: 16S rRNA (guanine(527)-N(7))-methyltransferase RsmG, partial [Lachnospiraceae bacterium]|nr:16S rRNA (guanine(527)-N(7))-methyltransferase RsmG [Lachnospiraceae bacterium]